MISSVDRGFFYFAKNGADIWKKLLRHYFLGVS